MGPCPPWLLYWASPTVCAAWPPNSWTHRSGLSVLLPGRAWECVSGSGPQGIFQKPRDSLPPAYSMEPTWHGGIAPVWGQAEPGPCCVASGQSLNLSELQSPQVLLDSDLVLLRTLVGQGVQRQGPVWGQSLEAHRPSPSVSCRQPPVVSSGPPSSPSPKSGHRLEAPSSSRPATPHPGRPLRPARSPARKERRWWQGLPAAPRKTPFQ